MNRRDFERLTLTYGGEPEKWPPEYRRDAARLVARTPDISRVLTSVRTLDSALVRQHQAVSDLRISHLRQRVLEQTKSDELLRFPRVMTRAWRAWLFAYRKLQSRALRALVVGTIAALCVAWAVEAFRGEQDMSRMLSDQLATAVGTLIVELLEFLKNP